MEYEEMKDIAKWNKCAMCGGDLVIRTDPKIGGRVVSCGQDHAHAGFQRLMTPTEHYNIGTPMPLEVEQAVKKKQQKTHTSELVEGWKGTVSNLLKVDSQTGELLTPEAVKGLVDWAHRYDLDPFRGHVIMMFGEPYPTIEAYLYTAQKSGRPYQYASSPMNQADRELYMVPEGAYAWLCHLWVDGKTEAIIGQGIVTTAELTEMSKKKPDHLRYPIVAAKPSLMAQKRAEYQALQRGFPLEAVEA